MNATNPIETLSNCIGHATHAFSLVEYEDRDWEHYKETNEDRRIKKTRRHTAYDCEVYAMFPQTWSSTALGFRGIGGRAFTSAYVCIIESTFNGERAVYFGGKLAYIIFHPNLAFFTDAAERKMVDAHLGKEKYER